jgi:hypothetical protein
MGIEWCRRRRIDAERVDWSELDRQARSRQAKVQGYEQSAVQATSDVGEVQAAMTATGVSWPGARPLCSSRAMTWRS